MKFGKGWVVTEFFSHTNERVVLSLLSARKSEKFVRQFLEQLYVDRQGSIDERIAYKKRPKSWPYPVTLPDPRFGQVMMCGHEPEMWACYCHEMALDGSQLSYKFKILRSVEDDLCATFKEVEECASVT